MGAVASRRPQAASALAAAVVGSKARTGASASVRDRVCMPHLHASGEGMAAAVTRSRPQAAGIPAAGRPQAVGVPAAKASMTDVLPVEQVQVPPVRAEAVRRGPDHV